MANTIQINRSTTAGATPSLDAGELGVNLTDEKLWVGDGTNNLLVNPTSSLGDTLYYSQDAQIQISDDDTNSNYHTMREFHCDRAGSFRIKFSAYIVSGTYYWAWRVYNATTSTVLYSGSYQQTTSGNGLDDGQTNSVHNYRRYRIDVDADKTRVGDKILIQMVSSTSGGTPVAGNGQNLTLKEFRVYLNRQYSASIHTRNIGGTLDTDNVGIGGALTGALTVNDNIEIPNGGMFSTPQLAVVSGSELITGTDSTFTNGLGNWATGNNWNTQEPTDGKMVCAATASNQRCYLTISALSLKTRYLLTYDASALSGTVTLRTWAGSPAGYHVLGTFVAGTAKTISFVLPSDSNTTIYIGAVASGAAITLDNISLKQEQASILSDGAALFGGALAAGGDLTLSKATPQIIFTDTLTDPDKTWAVKVNANSFYITESGVADRLTIAAGGAVTWSGGGSANANTAYTYSQVGHLPLTAKAADSDLLDGLNSSQFIRSDVNDSVTNHTTWIDGNKARFGNEIDLEIYHDGSNSYITDVGTGNLIIGTNSGISLKSSTENLLVATPNGSVSLYYDNANKLQTVTGGVNVSGTLTAGAGDFSSLRTSYHFPSWSGVAVFANTTADLVTYLSFGNSNPWGWIEVTLTGGFSHTNITGRYTKRFQIGRNASSAIHHQNSEVIASHGDVAGKFKIGAFEVSGSTLRIPIYSLTTAGNNLTVLVEGQLQSGAMSDSILAAIGLSTAVAVSNTETRDYLSLMTSRLGIGQASPAYELDVSGNANITGTLTAGGHVEFNSTFHMDVNSAGSDAQFLMHNSNNAHLNFLSGNSAGGHDGDNPGNTLIDFRKTRDFLIGASDNTGLSNRANYLTIAGDTGNIGIGGVAPIATSRLYVNNTINSGTAIYGYTTLGTGNVYGVYAQANSSQATNCIGLGAAANSSAATTNIAGEFYAVSGTNNYAIKTLGGDVWVGGSGASVGIGTADAGTHSLYVVGTTYLDNDVTVGGKINKSYVNNVAPTVYAQGNEGLAIYATRHDGSNYRGYVDFVAGRGSDATNGGASMRFFTQPRSTAAPIQALDLRYDGEATFSQLVNLGTNSRINANPGTFYLNSSSDVILFAQQSSALFAIKTWNGSTQATRFQISGAGATATTAITGNATISGALASTASYHSLNDGLVLHVPFGEGTGTSAKDRGPKGNNVTLNNSPTWGDGKFGNCIVLNGSTQYGEVAGSLSNDGMVSCSAWFNSDSINTLQNIFAGSGIYQYAISILSSKLAIHSGGTWFYGSTTLTSNTWYHVAFTWNGTSKAYKFYLNGVEDGSGTTDSTYSNGQLVVIGRYYYSSIRFFDGSIQNVRAWSRILRAGEVAALYSMESADAAVISGDIRATVTGAFPSGLLVSGSHATNGPVVQVANTVTNGNAWNMISNGSANTSGVGHLQFWNSTGSRWNLILDGDSSDAWFNGAVGIGTTAPGASTKLQVAGRGLFTGGTHDPGDGSPKGLSLTFESDVGVIRALKTAVASYDIAIQPTAGNVGIGTGLTAPGGLLHVKGLNNSAGDLWTAVGTGNCPNITIQNSSATDNTNAALFFKNDSTYVGGIGMRFTNHSSDAAQMRFSTCSGGTTRERMTLDETGNLGIGSDPGAYKLYVNGTSFFKDGMELDDTLELDGNFTWSGYQYFTGSAARIIADTADGSDTKALYVSGGGDAGMGRGAYVSMYGNDHASAPGLLELLSGNDGSIVMYSGGAERFRILNNGKIHTAVHSAVSTAVGDVLSYSSDAEYTVDHDSGNSNYYTMKSFRANKSGAFRIRWSGYIQSGSYYFGYRIYNATTNTVHYSGSWQSGAGSGNGLDDGQGGNVHAYRRFRVDVGPGNVNAGDLIELGMVSSNSGGTPNNGNGQRLYAKEFRVTTSAQTSGIQHVDGNVTVSGALLVNPDGTYAGPNTEAAYRIKFKDHGGVHNDTGIGLDGSTAQGQMWFNALQGFYWNCGTNGVKLTVSSAGLLTAAGGLAGTTAAFSGALTGTSATFSGSVTCTGGLLVQTANHTILDISGNAGWGDAYAMLRLTGQGNQNTYIRHTKQLTFDTGSATTATLTTGGNFHCYGTLSSSGALTVEHSSASVTSSFRNTHATGYGVKFMATAGQADRYIATFNDKDDAVKATIHGTGGATFSGSVICESSLTVDSTLTGTSASFDGNGSFTGTFGCGALTATTGAFSGMIHAAKSVSAGETVGLFIENTAGSAVGNKAVLAFGTDTGATATNNPRIEVVNTNASNGASKMVFKTHSSGGNITEAFRLNSDATSTFSGHVYPAADNTYNLGNTSLRWSSLTAVAITGVSGTFSGASTMDTLGVNTSSVGTYKLYVTGNTKCAGFMIATNVQSQGAAFFDSNLRLKATATPTGASYEGRLYAYNDTGVMLYYKDGYNTAHALHSASDYRLKENITDYSGSDACTLVKGVNAKRFDYIAGSTPSDQRNNRVGFMAHELQDAGCDFGGMVSGAKDEMMDDGKGNQVPRMQSVDYKAMVPILWSALQNALKRIEVLEEGNA